MSKHPKGRDDGLTSATPSAADIVAANAAAGAEKPYVTPANLPQDPEALLAYLKQGELTPEQVKALTDGLSQYEAAATTDQAKAILAAWKVALAKYPVPIAKSFN